MKQRIGLRPKGKTTIREKFRINRSDNKPSLVEKQGRQKQSGKRRKSWSKV